MTSFLVGQVHDPGLTRRKLRRHTLKHLTPTRIWKCINEPPPGDWSNLPRRGTDVEFGVHLPLISFAGEQRSLADLIAFTEAARDLGYTHLCANDHLVSSRPWLDGPTALAAVLPRSGQMTLATTVAVPVLRGPAATAKLRAAVH